MQTPTTLKGLEAAARGQRRQMAQLEAQMQAIRGQYDAAVAELTAVDLQLSQTRLQLAQSQTPSTSQNALVGARLAAMYKMGSFSIVDVLAGSASFTQASEPGHLLQPAGPAGPARRQRPRPLNAQVARLADAPAGQRAAR